MNGHLRSTTVLIQDMKVTLNDLQGVVWPSLKSFGVLFDMIFTDLTMEDTKKDNLFHSAKHNFNIFMKEKKFWSLLYQGGISSSVLSVFFTDKFALNQSDARISVAYKIVSEKH